LNSPVFNALVPVVLFIAMGFIVGRRGWIRAAAVKDLSNLVFMVLTPALLFRTMSTVHVQDLDFGPIAIYFAAAGLVFAATLAMTGFSSLAAARALAHTFSNTIMIGVPLVGLATMATVIASQALISGAFSVTKQVIQLGYLPRLNIEHTSVRDTGQIYIPFVNWSLFVAIVLAVVMFRSSSNAP